MLGYTEKEASPPYGLLGAPQQRQSAPLRLVGAGLGVLFGCFVLVGFTTGSLPTLLLRDSAGQLGAWDQCGGMAYTGSTKCRRPQPPTRSHHMPVPAALPLGQPPAHRCHHRLVRHPPGVPRTMCARRVSPVSPSACPDGSPSGTPPGARATWTMTFWWRSPREGRTMQSPPRLARGGSAAAQSTLVPRSAPTTTHASTAASRSASASPRASPNGYPTTRTTTSLATRKSLTTRRASTTRTRRALGP